MSDPFVTIYVVQDDSADEGGFIDIVRLRALPSACGDMFRVKLAGISSRVCREDVGNTQREAVEVYLAAQREDLARARKEVASAERRIGLALGALEHLDAASADKKVPS